MDDIYRRLAREIIKHEGRIAGDAKVFVINLVGKLRAEGYQITPAITDELSAYLTAMQDGIKAGIVKAAELASLAQGASVLQSAQVAALAEQAYKERWPDGLRLSDRLWNWQEDVRTGLTKVVQDGIKSGDGISKTIYAMQRTIERAHGGQRFKIVERYTDDWVKELHEAAVGLIHNPEDRALWNQVVGEAEDRILELKTTGTRHAAERVLDQMKKAVLKGKEKLADNAAKWWLYDKQLYHLQRIVRTEMATALHRGVIASAEDDASIIGFQWRLSASHPVTDICDYYADIDMGLGKGVWSKEAVPLHKAHPHCMCLLIPRVTPVRQNGSKNYADFLRNSPPDRRNQLLPKWAKAAVDQGVTLDSLIKADGLGLISKADARKLGLIVERGAYETAKAGGHYTKFYERYKNEYSSRLEKAVKSYESVIAEHEAWIKNPATKLGTEMPNEAVKRYTENKWPRDIARNAAYKAIIEGIIEERKK